MLKTIRIFTRTDKWSWILIFLILLLGFAVRFYKINNPIADWHSWRQADTASVSKIFLEEGIDLLRPRYHDISSIQSGYDNLSGWRFVEFPVFNAIHALLAKEITFLSFDAVGRLVSIIASSFSTLLIFLIGKRFMGNRGGLLSSLFFAILPFNIYFSRTVLPEPLAVAFIVLGLWLFVLWIDKGRFWQIFLSALFFALALLIKPYAAFYALPMVYLAFAKFGLRTFINLRLWIFVSLTLIPLFLWRAWMNQYLEGIPFWVWAFNGDNIRFRPSFWWWIFEERIGRMILGTWAIVIFVFGFLYHPKKDFPLFLHFLFLGQIAYFSVVATASVRHDYYQTLSIPAIALIMGAGTLALLSIKHFNRVFLYMVVLGCVLLGLGFSAYQIKEFYKINHPEIILAGQAVQRLTPKNALVIAPYNGDTAFLYQTGRFGWPIATLPMDKMINRLGAQYYVSVNFDQQTKEVMEKYKVLEKTEKYVVVRLK